VFVCRAQCVADVGMRHEGAEYVALGSLAGCDAQPQPHVERVQRGSQYTAAAAMAKKRPHVCGEELDLPMASAECCLGFRVYVLELDFTHGERRVLFRV
jgi:hypothetical protein